MIRASPSRYHPASFEFKPFMLYMTMAPELKLEIVGVGVEIPASTLARSVVFPLWAITRARPVRRVFAVGVKSIVVTEKYGEFEPT